MPRSVTPGPRPGALVLGHFHVRSRGFYGWRPGGSRDWHLLCTVSGKGRLVTPAGESELLPGRVILLAPETPQDYGIAEDARRWEYIWAHFLPPADWAELLRWPELSPGVGSLELSDRRVRHRTIGCLRQACGWFAGRFRRNEDFAWLALHEALLWCDSENPRWRETRIDLRVRKAMEYIAADLQRPFRMGGIAAAAGLSASQTIALFRRQLGQTPRRFWEGRRIEQARHLLERTHLTVSEVADAVGFADPFYFSTRFKTVLGASPREFRRRVIRESLNLEDSRVASERKP